MLRRIALIAVIAGGFAAAMYTEAGCSPYESPTEPLAEVRGGVFNAATGAPVGNAFLSLKRGIEVDTITRSAADGSFSFTTRAGAHRLEVIADGYQRLTMDLDLHGGINTLAVRLTPA
jgi:Carboxypeptidase regulatory-like domain